MHGGTGLIRNQGRHVERRRARRDLHWRRDRDRRFGWQRRSRRRRRGFDRFGELDIVDRHRLLDQARLGTEVEHIVLRLRLRIGLGHGNRLGLGNRVGFRDRSERDRLGLGRSRRLLVIRDDPPDGGEDLLHRGFIGLGLRAHAESGPLDRGTAMESARPHIMSSSPLNRQARQRRARPQEKSRHVRRGFGRSTLRNPASRRVRRRGSAGTGRLAQRPSGVCVPQSRPLT